MLYTVTRIGIAIGGAASLGLMLRTGHHTRSVLLVILFAIWVASPFALLLSRILQGAVFYVAALAVIAGSLIVYYGMAFGPPRPKPAAAFLMVPLASWLFIGLAALLSRGPRRLA